MVASKRIGNDTKRLARRNKGCWYVAGLKNESNDDESAEAGSSQRGGRLHYPPELRSDVNSGNDRAGWLS